jgi:hypothetical protein
MKNIWKKCWKILTEMPAHLPADQLHKLNELRKEGVLTDAEFAAQKEKLLAT